MGRIWKKMWVVEYRQSYRAAHVPLWWLEAVLWEKWGDRAVKRHAIHIDHALQTLRLEAKVQVAKERGYE